jgi:hypothetical protein
MARFASKNRTCQHSKTTRRTIKLMNLHKYEKIEFTKVSAKTKKQNTIWRNMRTHQHTRIKSKICRTSVAPVPASFTPCSSMKRRAVLMFSMHWTFILQEVEGGGQKSAMEEKFEFGWDNVLGVSDVLGDRLIRDSRKQEQEAHTYKIDSMG